MSVRQTNNHVCIDNFYHISQVMYDVSPEHTQYFSFDNLDLLQELVYETFVDKTILVLLVWNNSQNLTRIIMLLMLWSIWKGFPCCWIILNSRYLGECVYDHIYILSWNVLWAFDYSIMRLMLLFMEITFISDIWMLS